MGVGQSVFQCSSELRYASANSQDMTGHENRASGVEPGARAELTQLGSDPGIDVLKIPSGLRVEKKKKSPIPANATVSRRAPTNIYCPSIERLSLFWDNTEIGG